MFAPAIRCSVLVTAALIAIASPFSVSLQAAILVQDETDSRYLPTKADLGAISSIVDRFMAKYAVPGFSMAIARHGHFVYRAAFGTADQGTGEKVTTASLFRIASISKPITAVGILTLLEKGQLQLNSRVFGSDGILGFDYSANYPERVSKITIEDLLSHTSGGWQNDRQDPMFRDPNLDATALITWTVNNQPLECEPGTHFAYSNFGYSVLGRVVEKLTGQPYSEWIRENVLSKCGIQDMRVAGNTLAEKAPGEVVYYSPHGASPYNFNIRRMDSHGGWLGTPGDLVRFAISVDGFFNTPSLLNKETIQTMASPSKASPNYAKGWFVNAEPNWWHGGTLPGTATILVRTSENFCWAAFANTHEPGMDLALDQMMWEIKNSVSAWKN